MTLARSFFLDQTLYSIYGLVLPPSAISASIYNFFNASVGSESVDFVWMNEPPVTEKNVQKTYCHL